MDITQLVAKAVDARASDIHLTENSPPYFRIDEDLSAVADEPVLTHESMLSMLTSIVPKAMQSELMDKRGVDIGHQFSNRVRCRIIVFFERRHIKIVLRLIPMKVPSLERLGLAPLIGRFAELQRGMILVTGPSGSGKSTTLAALVDRLNSTRQISINTIENPIEYVFENKMALISQREIGDDVMDFSSGAEQALRQDPDVMMIGEMRDLETMRVALQAAETGHLLLSTLHTIGAVQTVARIIATFPEVEHDCVRDQIALSLAVVISQQLVKCIGGKGRIAALEIMVLNDHISKLIKENKILNIYEMIKGRTEGMQTLDYALAMLVKDGKINEVDGAQYAKDINAYHRGVKGMASSSDQGWIGTSPEDSSTA